MRHETLNDATTEEEFVDQCGLLLTLEILNNEQLSNQQKNLIFEMLHEEWFFFPYYIMGCWEVFEKNEKKKRKIF